MTEIPGTGKLPAPPPERAADEGYEQVSVVNVKQIKQKKKGGYEYRKEDLVWYNRMPYWGLFGLGGGLLLSILSVFSWRFLIFIPIGPIVGVIAWFIKHYLTRFGSKNDILIDQ